ncbi:MAG: tyrosine--tRNA ligase [Acidimicrobiales bacterium]
MTADDATEIAPDIAAELAELTAGTAEVLPGDGLAQRLVAARAEGRPLRVKLGIDPSGTDLTLGHAVVLRKLRQFQDHGHIAVLIVGDFTGRVGDPTGRNEVRQVRSAEETTANAATYLDQVRRILSNDRLEVRRNSEWLGTMDFSEVLGYTRMLTVARLLERDDFSKRYKGGQPISLMEFMYPLMQGLDSVFIEADVELGGTDQTYNNLVGRQLQQQLGKPAQTVITVPLLRGTDGADKMGKSLGNFIAISEPAGEQYGKVMSISDDLVSHYAELCCGWSVAEVAALHERLATDPFAAKHAVAHRIVELYWGAEAADEARDRWVRRFSQREIIADDLPEFAVPAGPVDLVELLVAASLVSSKGDARRQLAQGAIRLDGTKLDADAEVGDATDVVGKVLQRGKRQAVRLVSA